jgi:transcriptional regulator with XRE-family HTH domain
MPVLRQVVGETLRGLRLRQRRTLREVSASARVSLGYLSEVERGQKEPSSELLASICGALDVELSELFAEVSQSLRREEKLARVGRVALVGTNSTRLTPAAPAEAPGSATASVGVRSLAPVGAGLAPTAAA